MWSQALLFAGHFLPEEDDKFLEQVRAAVEEEERQAAAAANTEATKEAIATAEESRKASIFNKNDLSSSTDGSKGNAMEAEKSRSEPSDVAVGSERQVSGWEYNIVSNLPAEFYHYYYGSSTDMGTLIEVHNVWKLALYNFCHFLLWIYILLLHDLNLRRARVIYIMNYA